MPAGNGPWRYRTTRGANVLLRVVLDDQLFLDGRVDLRPLRPLVHQDPQVRAHDLQPGRDRPVTEGRLGHLEGQRRHRLRLHVDDVELRYLEARDVHLVTVQNEGPVAHQLARLAPGASQTRAVHDVVEARLQQLQ